MNTILKRYFLELRDEVPEPHFFEKDDLHVHTFTTGEIDKKIKQGNLDHIDELSFSRDSHGVPTSLRVRVDGAEFYFAEKITGQLLQ